MIEALQHKLETKDCELEKLKSLAASSRSTAARQDETIQKLRMEHVQQLSQLRSQLERELQDLRQQLQAKTYRIKTLRDSLDDVRQLLHKMQESRALINPSDLR